MHLTPDELLDLAEGTQLLASVPHLASCDRCRRELAELRDVLATLAVDVPEPSPLFWEHLSTRVRDAVAAEAAPARSRFGLPRWSWQLAAAMSVAVVAIAVSLGSRTPVPVGSLAPPPVLVGAPVIDVAPAIAGDDPSFNLLGDLAGSLDWDTAAEAGITMDVGAADTAVTVLNDAERSELQRLLREAISSSGA
jgi:hypothetical protein